MSLMASQVKLNNILYYVCFSFVTFCHVYFVLSVSCIHAQFSMKVGLLIIGKTIDCECLTIKLRGTYVDLKETCGNVTSENYVMGNSVICSLHVMFLM
jgi:nitrite reductase/ring-hydroxylating ferredoxin subunit